MCYAEKEVIIIPLLLILLVIMLTKATDCHDYADVNNDIDDDANNGMDDDDGHVVNDNDDKWR